MVGPTKLQPRRFSSFASRVDVGVIDISCSAAWVSRFGRSEAGGSNDHDERRQRPFRLDELQAAAGVVDRRLDLPSMPHDRRVAEQTLDVTLAEACDPRGVEPVERAAKPVALAKDRQPRETGLEPLEADLLEQPDVVDDRSPPLVVVVRAVLGGVTGSPPAAGETVLARQQALDAASSVVDVHRQASRAGRRRPR